ncbi:MAG TPA: sugar ABC transporter substrate-binding protein [Clostridiaceae bacterium]|nr:sugar ABC transporter substrate-binding protein [Clostridiaceae bacterium]
MKKLLAFVLAVLVLFSLAACNAQAPQKEEANTEQKSGESTETANTDNSKSDQLYIQVSALGNLDYFYDHKLGMKIVGEELGVRTEYVGPAEYDMNAMIAAFEQAIAKKPNGIVVVGFEPSLDPIVDKAIDAGIPVVTVDADLPTSKRIAFVGTGNVNAGRTGGEKLAELIGGKGKVAIMTKPGQSNLEERVAGYKEALFKYPDIEIVQIVDTQSDPVVAAQAAATLLQKYPDLAGIACVEAAGGSGAATAVKEAGLAGKVKIIAMDRGNEVLEAIEEGVISASVAQQTALMPYYAVQILYNLNNSKVDITTDNKAAGVKGVPSMVDTGVVIVDSSNYQYFKR